MKDKTVAGLLAIFFGGIGLHKFYLSCPGQGLLYLIFCWTFIPAILWFIEGIVYLSTSKENWDLAYNVTETRKSENRSETQQYDDLLKIQKLRETWVFSEDEFNAEKEKILAKNQTSAKNLSNENKSFQTILLFLVVIAVAIFVLHAVSRI